MYTHLSHTHTANSRACNKSVHAFEEREYSDWVTHLHNHTRCIKKVEIKQSINLKIDQHVNVSLT